LWGPAAERRDITGGFGSNRWTATRAGRQIGILLGSPVAAGPLMAHPKPQCGQMGELSPGWPDASFGATLELKQVACARGEPQVAGDMARRPDSTN
jgi:hypothetical protein